MPTAENDGVELYYELEGSGETVAFVNDVGFGAWLWGWQHRAVAGPHEALVWDLRGTGRSDAPPGPYAVETLAADLEMVLSAHGTRRVHLVGAGLGGMVALEYARSYDRAATLSLFGTAASGEALAVDPDEATGAPFDDPDALASSLEAVLSERFLEDNPGVAEGIAEWRARDDAGPAGRRAQAAAMAAFDRTDRLHEVTVPALVVHGEADAVVPLEAGRALSDGLPRGALETVTGAGHLAFVEQSRPVNDRLLGFLADHRRGEE
jgi:pimeloyl-ACP methyl ester carboxylesterase